MGTQAQWLRQFRQDYKSASRRNPSRGEWIDLDARALKFAKQGQCPGQVARFMAGGQKAGKNPHRRSGARPHLSMVEDYVLKRKDGSGYVGLGDKIVKSLDDAQAFSGASLRDTGWGWEQWCIPVSISRHNPPKDWHQRKLHLYRRGLAGASPADIGFAAGQVSAERAAREFYASGGVDRNPGGADPFGHPEYTRGYSAGYVDAMAMDNFQLSGRGKDPFAIGYRDGYVAGYKDKLAGRDMPRARAHGREGDLRQLAELEARQAAGETLTGYAADRLDDLKMKYGADFERRRGARRNPLMMVVENPNDEERRQWIDNDEGLYDWYRSSRLSMREFIKLNRAGIDEVIGKVTGGQKPAHYMKYGPQGPRYNPRRNFMPGISRRSPLP